MVQDLKAKADKSSLIDVPAGGSFDYILAPKGDKEIGDKMTRQLRGAS